MPCNTLFCKIFKCNSRISGQNKVQKSQPQSDVQAEIVQVDVDIDGCLKDHYHYNEYYENDVLFQSDYIGRALE